MKTITAIVETPKGSGFKYDHDAGMNGYRLKKTLPSGMFFPFDFGFIPGTKGEDGDPLDIIIISEATTFPGCIMECRIVGVIEATQQEQGKKAVRNDRFIGIAEASVLFSHISSPKDLPVLTELETFFINYNEAEGKAFTVTAIHGPKKAKKMIINGKE